MKTDSRKGSFNEKSALKDRATSGQSSFFPTRIELLTTLCTMESCVCLDSWNPMRELTPSEKYPPITRPLMAALSIPVAGPEISDRIAAFDSETLGRLPVKKQSVIEEFLSLGNKPAANIVKCLPARDDDTLDPQAIDQLLVNIHCEMQRISEEFQHGRRWLAG